MLCFKHYTAYQFSHDFFAGVVVAIIALPLSIAFGIASGVSPAQGILTAVVGGFFVSLLGGSRVQIGGPTGAFIVIVFSIVTNYGLSGLIISTFIAGFILILLGVFRFGSTIRYIPQPVIVGFTAGIAVVIFSSQLKDLLGIAVDQLPDHFLDKMMTIFQHLNSWNPWALLVGTMTFLIMVMFSRWMPRVPAAFFALVFVTTLTQLFPIPVMTIGSLYGSVNLVITPIDLSALTYQTIIELLPAAFTIAFLGAVESLLSATVADGMIGDRHLPHTELIGQGVANIASALVGGIPVTGAVARTSANVRNGGRTPIAGLVHALVLLLIVLFLKDLAGMIPMAALAGLLIHVSVKMGEWKEFRLVFRTSLSDGLALMTTFVVTIFIDLVFAIVSGLIVSAFLFIRNVVQAANITENTDLDDLKDSDQPDVKLPPGSFVFNLSGPFFFGAAIKFEESIRLILPKSQILILRMAEVSILDSTGTYVLSRLLKDAHVRKIRVILTEVHSKILQSLEYSGLIQQIGRENIFSRLSEVIKEIGNSQKLTPFSNNGSTRES